MTVMMIVSYDVSDPERFAAYNPGSLPAIQATLGTHGGSIAFAGGPEVLVGDGTQAVVGLQFPDADAAKAWLADPDYAEALAIRLESTTNITTLIVPMLGD